MTYNKFKKPVVKQPRVMRQWSTYQRDIFNDIAHGIGNTQVDALAGTGKTSTIVEGFYYIPKGKSTMMCAFNKSIQTELESRAPVGVEIKTLHAIGYSACRKAFPKMGQPDTGKLDGYIKAEKGDEGETYELRSNLAKAISLAKGCLASSAKEIDEIMDRYEVDTCDEPRESFIASAIKIMEATKKDTNRIDFDDMIWMPNVLGLRLPKYDMVFIDEAQDLNVAQISLALNSVKESGKIVSVGDQHQCVEVTTNVMMEDGTTKMVSELSSGDKILSYRNGENSYQTVTNIWASNETEGVRITTSSGKSLVMTNQHQIWASLPENKNKDTLVYLMYRAGFGFRVGVTNKGYSAISEDNISSRMRQEGGTKMWILNWEKSRETALTKEVEYSLQYGIPTCVFNGKARGLNQDHINYIFNKFGENGRRLLADHKLSFDHPHWITHSSTHGTIRRNVINFIEHSKKGSQVCLEWSEKEMHFCQKLQDNNITFTAAKGNNRFRIRKYFTSNRAALLFARNLQNLLGIDMSRTLSNTETRLNLLTASSLFVGMKVLVKHNNSFVLEDIVSIDKISGQFVDIEVDDSANFYGNDILSHNSIYQFRGADSNAIQNIVDRLQSKRMPLSVTYRCAKSIVELAQSIVPEIEAAPNAEQGLVDYCSLGQMEQKVKPGDFILSRVNAPLIKWCLALLKAKVPANIQGRDMGKSLFALIKKSNAKNVDSFLSWLTDYEMMEYNRLVKMKRDASVIQDKVECLRVLCEGTNSIVDVKDNIDRLFKDGDDKDRVMLSSTHKAKGLERERVFMLKDTYKPGKSSEESNLTYVAYTRAKKELYLVSGK